MLNNDVYRLDLELDMKKTQTYLNLWAQLKAITSLLTLLVALAISANAYAGPQPMLLEIGEFSSGIGESSIQVPAHCMDENLDTPEVTDKFQDYTDGINVTRTKNGASETLNLSQAIASGWLTAPNGSGNYKEVGFPINKKQLDAGATFKISVSGKDPQFLASGNAQFKKVKSILKTNDDVVQGADSIIDDFVKNEISEWGPLLDKENNPYFSDEKKLKSNLKQKLLWSLNADSSLTHDKANAVLEQCVEDHAHLSLEQARKILVKNSDIINNADGIINGFIRDKSSLCKPFLGNEYDSLFVNNGSLKSLLKQTIFESLDEDTALTRDDAVKILKGSLEQEIGMRLDDMGTVLGKNGDVVKNADDIVDGFVKNRPDLRKSLLRDDYDSLLSIDEHEKSSLKRHLLSSLLGKSTL